MIAPNPRRGQLPILKIFVHAKGYLKRLLVLGDMGRTREGREVLLPGAGPMGIQIPPAGAMDTLNRRDINTPAPNCTNKRFGIQVVYVQRNSKCY